MLAGSLEKVYRKEGRLPEDIIRIYGYQILVALAYLHASDVIYGDLKGANILVGDSGRVKLTDFGSAQLFDSSALISGEGNRPVSGTLNFIAPEVF